MNIKFVLAFCTLLLFIQATDIDDDYYTGFVYTLGIDTHVTDDGVDCTEPTSRALYQFRDAIIHAHSDDENVLRAVADIIDKLKFEVSPLCRTFYGEFLDFMNTYYGDAEEIKSIADRNLKEHNAVIKNLVIDCLRAGQAGDDYELGKGHANILKLLLDLEKSEISLEKTVETVLEKAKEEIAKLGETVNETVEKVKEELVEMIIEEEDILKEAVAMMEEPEHQENEPIPTDMQVDDTKFNEQMDYDYVEIVGTVDVQHEEGEDDYEAGVVEEESVLAASLEDQEEIAVYVDLKNYPENDNNQEKEEEKDDSEEEDEKEIEEEEEEEAFSTDVDVVKVKVEQQREEDEEEDSDNSDDDYDAYSSDYEDQVVEIQKRVLSQDYHYNYDL